MNQDSKQELIVFFFNFKNHLYLYHLSTYKYPRHVAVASLLDKFDDLIDKMNTNNNYTNKILKYSMT